MCVSLHFILLLLWKHMQKQRHRHQQQQPYKHQPMCCVIFFSSSSSSSLCDSNTSKIVRKRLAIAGTWTWFALYIYIFNLSPFHWTFSLVRWLYHICFNFDVLLLLFLLLLLLVLLFEPSFSSHSLSPANTFVAAFSCMIKHVRYSIVLLISNLLLRDGFLYFVIISPLLYHSFYSSHEKHYIFASVFLKNPKK